MKGKPFFAERASAEPKLNSGGGPLIGEIFLNAVLVKHVATCTFENRRLAQPLNHTNIAEIVILLN